MPLDGAGHVVDEGTLRALVEPALLVAVGDPVTEDLVSSPPQRLRDVRAEVVDRGVHLRLGGDPELVEELEEAPDPDPIAVVPPRVDAVALGLVRRGDGRALAAAETERLDVERDVDREPPTVRPAVVGAIEDAPVRVASMALQRHHVFLPENATVADGAPASRIRAGEPPRVVG